MQKPTRVTRIKSWQQNCLDFKPPWSRQQCKIVLMICGWKSFQGHNHTTQSDSNQMIQTTAVTKPEPNVNANFVQLKVRTSTGEWMATRPLTRAPAARKRATINFPPKRREANPPHPPWNRNAHETLMITLSCNKLKIHSCLSHWFWNWRSSGSTTACWNHCYRKYQTSKLQKPL